MPDDFLTTFYSTAFAKGNPLAPLSLLFLFLARFLPIIALSPFLGARVMPHPVKIIFALCMFVIFLPHLLAVSTRPVGFNLELVVLSMKEFFVGLMIGYMMSVPFQIVQNVGMIIDHQRGGASLMVNDPTIQNQSSPLGTLFNMVLIWMFFAINGPFLFFDSIMQSYTLIPPDKFFNSKFFLQGTPFWTMQVTLFQKIMSLSIQLAAPALLAILMTDVFLGIANRLAPQVQITFLGMPLKSLLALLVVCVGWKLFNTELVKQLHMWLNVVNSMIQMFSTGEVPIIAPTTPSG